MNYNAMTRVELLDELAARGYERIALAHATRLALRNVLELDDAAEKVKPIIEPITEPIDPPALPRKKPRVVRRPK